ncbi:phage tail tape measure protein [Paenibacillus larvae]|nr:phage tail tape measure protein [Paenibacillus larvae]
MQLTYLLARGQRKYERRANGRGDEILSPIAHALGWSLEESSAATMSLANSGLKGSIAGQAFASSHSFGETDEANGRPHEKDGYGVF